MPSPTDLGSFGVWAWGPAAAPIAALVEDLGFTTLWIGGSPAGDLAVAETCLETTRTLRVATGIVNIWKDDAVTVAASFHRLEDRYPGRFVLGIGAGHREAIGERYTQPYQAVEAYLDQLDRHGVRPEQRLVAALGPKMLQLAAERSLGAHPYLTTPEHTAAARRQFGDGPLLAPEHKVVPDPDPVRARTLGRSRVRTPYLGLVNYLNSFRRLGFDDTDFVDGGSDRLIDAVVAHGTPEQVAARLREHLDAGATHVTAQLLVEDGADPAPGYRALAQGLRL